jgi:biotin synthase
MNKEEIIRFLKARGSEQEKLFEQARAIRQQYFEDKAVIRGVIEVTDACKVNCDYCPMRRDNKNNRYVMNSEQIVKATEPIKDSGIKVIFLQGGEVPATTKIVGKAIPRIRNLFDDIEILLCLGDKSREEYEYLKNQGADSYILKHETSDLELHNRMRHTTLDSRLKCLQDLLDLGYNVGTGTIVGLPRQTLESLAEDILLPRKYGTHMTSCSPLIPAKNTPLENYPAGDVETTLNTLALMRIVNPRLLIPTVSALEKLQEGGQLRGFNAGANVITVNYTPEKERAVYRIYGKDRYVVKRDHALRTIEKAGLEY